MHTFAMQSEPFFLKQEMAMASWGCLARPFFEFKVGYPLDFDVLVGARWKSARGPQIMDFSAYDKTLEFRKAYFLSFCGLDSEFGGH